MSSDLLAFASLALLAIGAIVLAEWATRQHVMHPLTSRRLIHLTVGLFVAIAAIVLKSAAWLFWAAFTAAALNIVSVWRGWLPSVHGAKQGSIGTVTFPLSIVVVLPFLWDVAPLERYPLCLAFVVLAISDPLASIVGARFKGRRLLGSGPGGKTLAGTMVFGLSAWLLAGLMLTQIGEVGRLPYSEHWIWHMAAMVAIVAAAAEAVGKDGWDNLLIVIFVVLVLQASKSEEAVRFLGWCIAISALFAVVANRIRFLRPDGAIMAGLLGGTFLLLGGWTWIVAPLAFFVPVGLVSLWSIGARSPSIIEQARGSRRDAVQVLANGGAAWLLVVLNDYTALVDAYWLFVGTFAAVAADSLATEVGVAVGGRTWFILSGRPVTPGTSGGVSVAGLLAAMLGALIVALAGAAAVGELKPAIVGLITAAGFLAALVDSFFGSTLQALYRTSSGATTEAAETDGRRNELTSGLRFVTNDTVNFVCALTGAGFVAMGLLALA